MDDWANPGKTQATLYPLESISKIPVSMFAGQNDGICDHDVAQRESQKIKTLQNFYSIKDAGHGFPTSNFSDYFTLLKQEVVTGTTLSSPNRQEITLKGVEKKGGTKGGSTDGIDGFD